MANPSAGVVSTSDAPAVLTHETDGVLVITINRPKVRNAVDGATARALAEAFDQLDARDDLAVGVLTGAGGTFSAGMLSAGTFSVGVSSAGMFSAVGCSIRFAR